ncbi:MAG: alcohol dehydrogenase catalytic domain-containing protein [Chloroflexota bacterium]
MKALQFQYNMARIAYAMIAGKITPRAYVSALGPLSLADLPEPRLIADDWTVLHTARCGICGSDTKEVFIDADFDNPLSTLVSFPAVLGHEVVGTIEKVGSAVKDRRVGERVAVNPWLPCGPRGIEPPCWACQQGLYPFCEHFTEGRLPAGMHTGNNKAVSGGFAPRLPAHESQLFPIPDEVTFDQAVLADPFSVSLHAILKAPPAEGALALIYGCGTLGILSVGILHALYPKTKIAVVARHPIQEKLAYEMGATRVIRTYNPVEVIETIAEMIGKPVYRPPFGLPWLLRGADVLYDTIGSPQTLEVGLRVAQPRASIVVTGVARPKRFEWSPHYFKEVNLMGSNAFGIEDFEGERLHSFEIYFKLLTQKRLQFPDLITHRFRLEQYKEALLISHNKEKNKAVKVVFDFDLG